MTEIWISAAGLCIATLIGAVLGFLFKELPHKWNDTILGYQKQATYALLLGFMTLLLMEKKFE